MREKELTVLCHRNMTSVLINEHEVHSQGKITKRWGMGVRKMGAADVKHHVKASTCPVDCTT